ncbi:Crp/Fnr family transcriptional regulator [Flavobacterium zepuense]|uniref:Crp/Fnr family transcriptional regulator n=2 Tax=Flavobacterium zepuense TaxID=2593302 RepID=A0A552VA68_9FLAO|nr:Crp/Fnr family transcriptional regulator [Flavobacterium zepuense]
MDQLFDYINNYAPNGISQADFELLKGYFTHKKLRKRQYFLQEGDVCKHFAFVLKGAMRQYTIDDKGTEHIVQLSVENWWVGDRESWTMLTPSIYNIDAWEDTELLLVTRAATLELLDRFPAFREMTTVLDEKNNIANQRRITSSISASAEKRYTNFIECYPSLLERFPQHMIASYLGITKDTLSRVKRQLLYKE